MNRCPSQMQTDIWKFFFFSVTFRYLNRRKQSIKKIARIANYLKSPSMLPSVNTAVNTYSDKLIQWHLFSCLFMWHSAHSLFVQGDGDMEPVSFNRGGQWATFTTFHLTHTGWIGNCMSKTSLIVKEIATCHISSYPQRVWGDSTYCPDGVSVVQSITPLLMFNVLLFNYCWMISH